MNEPILEFFDHIPSKEEKIEVSELSEVAHQTAMKGMLEFCIECTGFRFC